MSIFFDTSVLIRYLTGDPPQMLPVARELVDGTKSATLTGAILAETAYVLLSFYVMPREKVVDALVDLVRKENVVVRGINKDVATRALLLCRPSGRVSFTDAMLWAVARSAPGAEESPAVVYSFDRRFPSDGIELRDH